MSKKEFPCSRMAWNEVKQRDELQEDIDSLLDSWEARA